LTDLVNGMTKLLAEDALHEAKEIAKSASRASATSLPTPFTKSGRR
jgi:hypothetical protein